MLAPTPSVLAAPSRPTAIGSGGGGAVSAPVARRRSARTAARASASGCAPVSSSSAAAAVMATSSSDPPVAAPLALLAVPEPPHPPLIIEPRGLTLLDVLSALIASRREHEFSKLVGLSRDFYHDTELLDATARVTKRLPALDAALIYSTLTPRPATRLTLAIVRRDVKRAHELLRAVRGREAASYPDIGVALGYACMHDGPRDTELVRALLAAGAPPSTLELGLFMGPIGFLSATPLHNAAQWSRDIVAMLLDAGSDINARGTGNQSGLTTAAGFGQLPIVQLLLAQPGIDVNIASSNGTALLNALDYRLLPIASELIRCPSLDFTAVDRTGRNVLHRLAALPSLAYTFQSSLEAVADVAREVVQRLPGDDAAQRAVLDARDTTVDRRTPLGTALAAGNEPVARALRDAGAHE